MHGNDFLNLHLAQCSCSYFIVAGFDKIQTRDSLSKNESTFDEDWEILIDCFRLDPVTKRVCIFYNIRHCLHVFLHFILHAFV